MRNMKKAIVMGALVSCFFLSRAAGQDAAGTEEKAGCIIVAVTEFNETRTLSTMSPSEVTALRKSIAAANEAAREAYDIVKKAWHDKYDPPDREKKPLPPAPTSKNPDEWANYSKQVAAQQQESKVPPFPLKKVPKKEVRELETCATGDAARERVKFYETGEAEPRGKTLSATSAGSKPFGAHASSTFSPSKFPKKDDSRKRPEVDQKAKEEVMKQFEAEVEKILSGAAEEKAKPDKPGVRRKEELGSGTTDSLKSPSLGPKK